MRQKIFGVALILLFSLVGCSSTPDKKNSEAAEQKPLIAEGIDKIQSSLQEAELHYKARNYVQAEALYQKVIENDPNNIKALYRLGNISFREQKWEQAQEYYRQVIQNEPRHSRAQYNLAMTHLTLAERHLKFYAAHADDSANLSAVSKLVGALQEISNPGSQSASSRSTSAQSSSLDELLDELSQ